MRVAAVVVTYNRADLLEKTLAGLEAQDRPVDRIIVVDNASTDRTPQMLAEREAAVPTTVTRLKKNTGGAGGFAHGIQAAFGAGYDAYWIMDDDTVPRPGALAELLTGVDSFAKRHGHVPSFACSMVLWTDGELCEMNTPDTTWDWPRDMAHGKGYQLVKSCSFVSCLITADAVRECGLPYREYFIWYDDAEYTMRLSKFRPGIFVADSKVDHLLGENRGVNFGDVTDANVWKFEYGVRNQISAAFSLRSPTIAVQLAENMLKQLHGSGVSPKLRLRLLKAGLKGLVFHPKKRFARTVR